MCWACGMDRCHQAAFDNKCSCCRSGHARFFGMILAKLRLIHV